MLPRHILCTLEEDKRPEYTAEILGEKLWKVGLKVENGTIKPKIEAVEKSGKLKNCMAETCLGLFIFHI